MKILQITHHTLPCIGGIEKFAFDLCIGLKAKKIYSEILCLNNCPGSKKLLPKEEEINGVKIKRIPFLDLKYYKIAPFAIFHLKDFDIIHVHNIGFFSDFLAFTKPIHRKKLVINTHGGFFHTKNMSFLKKIYFNTLSRLSLSMFDIVIADSKNDENIFSKIIPKKTVLVANGVDISPFLKLWKKKEKNSFLFVGRLSKNKALAKLIKTFAVLSKKAPDVKLRIIGADFDKLKTSFKQLSFELGAEKNIEILGEVDKKKLLEQMDKSMFAVSASEYEGFGIAVIEQMAARQIPVLSRIPNFEWFTENGKAGYIVDFSDENKAAKKIFEIMGKSEKELSEKSKISRETAKKFSMDKMVEKYERIYNGILSG